MFQILIGVGADELAPEMFIRVDFRVGGGGGDWWFWFDGQQLSALVAEFCILLILLLALCAEFHLSESITIERSAAWVKKRHDRASHPPPLLQVDSTDKPMLLSLALRRDTSVMPTEELKQDAARYLMQTYTRQPLSIVRGRGTKVYDLEGREYLDFVGGIAVNVLGHGHPDLVQAIQRQAAQLIHTSNLYYTEPQVKLAQMLVDHSFADKVFFCNSGAEANEAAIKLARRYSHDKYGAGRFEIVTMKNSFHGRTFATLTATGQEKVQKDYEPLLPGFCHVAFNNLEELEQVRDRQDCGDSARAHSGRGGCLRRGSRIFEAGKKSVLTKRCAVDVR